MGNKDRHGFKKVAVIFNSVQKFVGGLIYPVPALTLPIQGVDCGQARFSTVTFACSLIISSDTQHPEIYVNIFVRNNTIFPLTE